MSTILRRALVALLGALASGVLAGAFLIAAARTGPPAGAPGALADGGWTSRSRAWFTVRGVYTSEVHENGLHYTWTSPAVRFVIPHIDRTVPHTLTFTVSARRPPDVPLPTLTWSVDGVAGAPVPVGNDFAPVTIDLPARPLDRAVVTLQIANPWDPGPDDDRQLGVFVQDVRLARADGRLGPTWIVVGSIALSAALVVFPIWLAGLSRGLTVAASIGIAAAVAWMTSLDGAFLGPFPDALLEIAAAGSVPMLLAAGAGLLRARQDVVWPGVAVIVIASTTLKLALFAHPLAIVGDGVFQVHRADLVRAGEYFFTSITPRPFFEFPYAIALYVAAMPFWSWVPRELDRVWLLRAVSLAADALAGLALAAMARRAWDSRRAALFVALLWPFARAPFEALSNANLTNAFGQSVFAVAVAGLAWSLGSGVLGWPMALASGAVLAVAFLSHFSTLSVGVPLVGLVTGCVILFARRPERWRAIRIVVVLIAAVAIAYALYYRHFGEVYQKTIDRVMTEQPVDTGRSAIAASPWVKLKRWATAGSDDYGLPGIALGVAAVVGTALLLRRRPRDVWTLVLAGWLATWVAFTALGILTSVQMRVNLAAAPAFVCLGAYALDRLSAGTAAFRAVAAVVALLVVWDGVKLWRICLGG